MQAIPRKLWLDKSGKHLVQWPVVEIEKLRVNQVQVPSKLLKGGSVIEVTGVIAAQVSSCLYASKLVMNKRRHIWVFAKYH